MTKPVGIVRHGPPAGRDAYSADGLRTSGTETAGVIGAKRAAYTGQPRPLLPEGLQLMNAIYTTPNRAVPNGGGDGLPPALVTCVACEVSPLAPTDPSFESVTEEGYKKIRAAMGFIRDDFERSRPRDDYERSIRSVKGVLDPALVTAAVNYLANASAPGGAFYNLTPAERSVAIRWAPYALGSRWNTDAFLQGRSVNFFRPMALELARQSPGYLLNYSANKNGQAPETATAPANAAIGLVRNGEVPLRTFLHDLKDDDLARLGAALGLQPTEELRYVVSALKANKGVDSAARGKLAEIVRYAFAHLNDEGWKAWAAEMPALLALATRLNASPAAQNAFAERLKEHMDEIRSYEPAVRLLKVEKLWDT